MSRLKSVRIDRGLTQRQVSEKAGVSLRVLQNYEQGVKRIDHARLETILRLCLSLECGMEDICESETILQLLKEVRNP